MAVAFTHPISPIVAATPPPGTAADGSPRAGHRRPGLRRLFRKCAHTLVKPLPWRYQDQIYFFDTFGRLPDLRDPKGFNEKVLYRKCVHGEYPRYTRLADKYAVRGHVAASIGCQYLIPLVSATADPGALLALPHWRQTVIKASHGAGMVEIVREEPDANAKRRIVERCAQWLRTDFSLASREIHYRGIHRQILVEQYIGDEASVPVDYKFHMFRQHDGRFEYVLQVIYNRFNSALAMTFFVNNLDEAFHRIRDEGRDPPCPADQLRQALELSKVLANDFDYARVDWYIQQGRIYFGELTFTPGAGLVTGLDRGLDRIMGDMWQLRRARPGPCSPARRASTSTPCPDPRERTQSGTSTAARFASSTRRLRPRPPI
ncbi:hypothetical protein HH299_14360, partial [Xanthomonas sp. Kuri4-2]